eukprot:TRINITY_DN4329_c0_g1_i2.p1 TRINITY_DN4329_c0_g1~~TRINITY_DN4329_c0_g1_i2.p1  ORF type:complete len:274 (-),score=45.29 TRINITY_DN4329_c0_g1_i2:64-846(-)
MQTNSPSSSNSEIRKLVLIRHGESVSNRDAIFTGWTDVELSARGLNEAKLAGIKLKNLGYSFDLAYTSRLKRAIKTLWMVLEEMQLEHISVVKDWRLNERHYGGLQGFKKRDTARKYGNDQVLKWRRSYKERPPALELTDDRHPRNDPRYADLCQDQLPSCESMEDASERFLPAWNESILPAIKAGKKVVIAGHGNLMRCLVVHLDKVSDEEILSLNIPTGIPLVYEFDADMVPIRSYYLADDDYITEAQAAIAKQGMLS